MRTSTFVHLIILTFSLSAKAIDLLSEAKLEIHKTQIIKIIKTPNEVTDFFKSLPLHYELSQEQVTAVWTPGTSKIAFWFPQLRIDVSPSNPQLFETEYGLILAIPDHGILFCKGCDKSEMPYSKKPSAGLIKLFFPEARAEYCPSRDSSFLKIISVVGQKNIFTSLKSCDWSLSEIIKKTYEDSVKTVGDLVSGQFFENMVNSIRKLDATLGEINEKFLPFLDSVISEFPEIYDAMICDFTKSNFATMATGVALRGAGTTGTTAKVAFNMERYLEKVRVLATHSEILPLLRSIKAKNGGKISAAHAAAIAAIEKNTPFKKVQWSRKESLEKHLESHSELGFKTVNEYETAAVAFAERESNSTMAILNPIKKTWTKYDPATKEILVVNSTGDILTYHKANHWTPESQFERFLSENSGTILKRERAHNTSQ